MRRVWIAAAVVLAGCAGGADPGAPTPGAPAFAYVVPQPATLVYERVDSSLLSMQVTGMGDMDIDVAVRTLAELSFEPSAAGGVQVGITITELEGSATNPMTGSQTFSETPGPAVVRVDADGDVEVVQKPTLPAELAQVAGGESLLRNYFIQLPSRDVAMGVEWVDTVRVSEDAEGLSSTSEAIIRSTWARDTTVAGQGLRVIESLVDLTASVAGNTQGVRIEQSMAGNATATTLWDAARHLIVHRVEEGELSGTMALPDMGQSGMPLSMTTRSVMRLREGM